MIFILQGDHMKRSTANEIARLQDNLLIIRKIAGWTAAELGDQIGVTKQTISNLENKKTLMSKTQYIAIRAVLDDEIKSNPDNSTLAEAVNLLLDTEDISKEDEKKIIEALALVSCATGAGVSSAVVMTMMTTLLSSLGCTIGISGALAMGWLTRLRYDNKKTKKKK